jgi:GT2 family glycosyltransferase
MRILGYIHTFNDADVIEQGLASLQRQSRPPEAIVVVDNASTDETVDRIASKQVVVIQNPTNLGTSGAIRAGFQYALDHGFDFVWVLDADSVPEPEALSNLTQFFLRLTPPEQERLFFLTGRVAGEAQHRPMVFTESGGKLRPAAPALGADYGRCDCALWSGTLYRMAAVEKIGFPHPDYFVDWAELEYGYRAHQLGFVSFVVNNSVLHQDIGRNPGVALRKRQLGPFSFTMYDAVPPRCYLFVRNSIYFWLYECRQSSHRTVIHVLMVCLGFTASFAVRPLSRRRQVVACLRGIWDGLTMQLERRY